MFKNSYRRLMNNKFWKSVFTLSSGQIIAQIINFMSIPFVSRIYTKEQFGFFGIISSTGIIILTIIKLGIGPAIMVPKSDEESKKILKVGIYIQVFFSIFIMLFMAVLGPYFKFFSTTVDYNTALLLLFLYILLSMLSTYLTLYINRMGLNRVFFVNSLISAITTVVVTIPLGLMKIKFGLLIGTLVSLTIANLHMLKRVNPFRGGFKLQYIKEVFVKYKNYVIYQYPANLMTTLSDQLPNLIINQNFSAASLGDYTQLNKVFKMPFAVLATPIQTIYFRTVTQMHREEKDIYPFTISLIRRMMLVAFLPILVVMVFGEYIFSFVLGSQWRFVGTLSAVFALSFLFAFVSECIAYCRIAIGRQRLNLFMSVLDFIIIIGSLVLGLLVFKSLFWVLFIFAIANTAWQIINITATIGALGKKVWPFLVFSLGSALIIAALAIFLRSFVY